MVKTKSVAAYWAVRQPGIAGTEAGKKWSLGKSENLANTLTLPRLKVCKSYRKSPSAGQPIENRPATVSLNYCG
ncbi:MAG: hypothetical protein ACLPVJ_15550, partial [Syntrophobacteraceae bacterium]